MPAGRLKAYGNAAAAAVGIAHVVADPAYGN